MYVTKVILRDAELIPYPYFMHHPSMVELKEWVVFNHMRLGTARVGVEEFEVSHKDGSQLSEAEMSNLMEAASVEAWADREIKIRPMMYMGSFKNSGF